MKHRILNVDNTAIFLIFLFYASTNSFWAYRLFHESDVFPAVACILPISLLLIKYCRSPWKINLRTFLAIVSIYSVPVIWSSFSLKMILFYGMCAMLMLDNEIADESGALKYFYWFSLIFAVGTFINVFMPGLYRSVILPNFSRSGQYKALVKWSKMNQFIIPGFANQTSFNAPHFIYGIGYIVCGYFTYKKIQNRKIIIAAILFVCLVLTNKRAHFIFYLMSLTLTYYVSGDRGKRGKRFLILLMIGIAILAFILFILPKLNIGVFSKFNNMMMLLESNEDVTSGRIDLYRHAIKYFLQNPVLGIGWEGYRKIPELAIRGVQTHNIYLELLCETGIVGFLIFLHFFIFALLTALKNCKSCGNDREKMIACFCLFMQIFFLLYGLTGNPLYDPPYYIPYFISCAFTFSLDGKLRRRAAASRRLEEAAWLNP